MSDDAIITETAGTDVPVETAEPTVTPDVTETTETTDTSDAEASEEVVEETPFQMEWPDGYEATEDFTGIVTDAAKDAGITDGKVAGAYTAKVIAALQEAADKQVAADDAALKADWGADYQTNMQECKEFVKRLSAKAGLSEADVAVLGSPKGMRLVQAIRTEVGEGAAAVGKPVASAADESWAREVMTNPNHADYAAFHNPSDPRWRALNARYNKVKGF